MRRIKDPIPERKEGGKADPYSSLLNYAFHALHIGIILFTLFGWMLQATRLAHLILIILTLFSWYVLGFWLGEGYCPITHWHWMIRRKIPGSHIPDSYIKLLLDRVTGKDINSVKVNLLTLVVTLMSGGISLVLNVAAWI